MSSCPTDRADSPPPTDGQANPTRITSLLVVVLLWAGIYLPALPSQEFKGEEATRVLPAIAMLETGEWILPSIGGEPYYKKPPVINWLVAGAMWLTGSRSEAAARLPSAVFILAFALQLILQPSRFTRRERLLMALAWMTHFAIIEKGRLIEIEAVYIAMTGMAMYCWIARRSLKAGPWGTWLPIGALLTLGLLTKGPQQPVLVYILVVCTLVAQRRLRDILHPAQWIALAVSAGLFVAWGWAVHEQIPASRDVGGTWSGQLFGRIVPADIQYGKWVVNVLKALGHLLPWLLLAPLMFTREAVDRVRPELRGLFRGGRWALVIGFVSLAVMPGVRSRYVMPVYPLACVLIGWSAAHVHLSDRQSVVARYVLWGLMVVACATAVVGLIAITASPAGWAVAATTFVTAGMAFVAKDKRQGLIRLAVAYGVIVALASFQEAIYRPIVGEPFQRLRPIGWMVDHRVPDGEPVYVYRPGRNAFLYYLPKPVDYLLAPREVDEEVEYLILRQHALEHLTEIGVLTGRRPTVLYELPERVDGAFRLVRLARRPRTRPASDQLP